MNKRASHIKYLPYAFELINYKWKQNFYIMNFLLWFLLIYMQVVILKTIFEYDIK